MALEIARESIVLLKNDASFLPIPTTKRVLVTGQGCHSLAYQSGGWTIHWRGATSDSEFTYGTTIYEELRSLMMEGAVEYLMGVTVQGGDAKDGSREAAIAKASAGDVDVVVACIGEKNYAEKPGDIDDPMLPAGQVEFVRELSATGVPVVAVLVEGRAMLLQGIPDMATAVLHAMLPGPSGGRAVAEVITGAVNPSGRLPITYPKYADHLPQYFRKVQKGGGGGGAEVGPAY